MFKFKRPSLAASTLLAGMTALTSNALAFDIQGDAGTRLNAETITTFDGAWAMDFLPNGDVLVTTKGGRLFLVGADGTKAEIAGLPEVVAEGQGGLGDVVVHPDFSKNNWLYMSFVEAGSSDKAGAVVFRAKLNLKERRLTGHERLWTQTPKVTGRGHYSHKIAFGPKNGPHAGKIFITSGDRQKLKPAQDLRQDLGKLIRLNEDGSVPADNPWQSSGKRAKSFWSMGHRNLLGIDFDNRGRLWTHEMGPRHGDELNLIQPGRNYGWPVVSEGSHYSGKAIPSHNTDRSFMPPNAFWVPSIAPSGLVMYDGNAFPKWRGDALIGGLVSKALVHVEINGTNATEVERFEWGKRIRDVEQGPDGALWVLEDRRGGRLLRLVPN